jgi:hypothetical protein
MSKTECSDHKNGISFSVSNRFVVPRYFASQVCFIGSKNMGDESLFKKNKKRYES